MKKILAALALAIAATVALAPADARGAVPDSADVYVPSLIATSTDTDSTIGWNGVVWSYAFNNLSKFKTPSGAAATATVSTLPYASRLLVKLINGGGSLGVSSINCSTFQISGRTSLGVQLTESVALINTPAFSGANASLSATTAYAYEAVTKVNAAGCTGADNASDRVRIQVSRHVGLPVALKLSGSTSGTFSGGAFTGGNRNNNLAKVCVVQRSGNAELLATQPRCGSSNVVRFTGALSAPTVGGAVVSSSIDARYGVTGSPLGCGTVSVAGEIASLICPKHRDRYLVSLRAAR